MEFPSTQPSGLNTAASYIGELFKNTTVFKVQHYQRGIAWDNLKIKAIIEDVGDAMERGLPEYFIGPITLLQTTHGHYDIIDGQQRLTAISLILTSCKSALYEPDTGLEQSEIQDCMRHARRVEDILGPTNAPKLHHKDEDEAQNFRDLMARRGDKKKKTHLNAMQRKIDEVLECWPVSRIEKFTSYLLDHVLCIVICSSDKNIAYQIFETLNARGENFIEQLSGQTSIDDNKAKDIFIALRNHKAQTAGDRLGKSADLHIEHVLPKVRPDRGWEQFSPDEHGLYKQRLGNLMLLSKKINEKVARCPYSRKREHYNESRYLDVAFIDDDVTDWNAKVIRDRQLRIAKEISRVWTVETE